MTADDTTLAHTDDACEAVGVSVLALIADGAESVTVRPDGSGGYIVEEGRR